MSPLDARLWDDLREIAHRPRPKSGYATHVVTTLTYLGLIGEVELPRIHRHGRRPNQRRYAHDWLADQ